MVDSSTVRENRAERYESTREKKRTRIGIGDKKEIGWNIIKRRPNACIPSHLWWIMSVRMRFFGGRLSIDAVFVRKNIRILSLQMWWSNKRFFWLEVCFDFRRDIQHVMCNVTRIDNIVHAIFHSFRMCVIKWMQSHQPFRKWIDFTLILLRLESTTILWFELDSNKQHCNLTRQQFCGSHTIRFKWNA